MRRESCRSDAVSPQPAAQYSLPAWRAPPGALSAALPRPALKLMTLRSAEQARRSVHGPGGHRGGPGPTGASDDSKSGAMRSTGAAPGACPPRPLRCLCGWVLRSVAPGEGVGSALRAASSCLSLKLDELESDSRPSVLAAPAGSRRAAPAPGAGLCRRGCGVARPGCGERGGG